MESLFYPEPIWLKPSLAKNVKRVVICLSITLLALWLFPLDVKAEVFRGFDLDRVPVKVVSTPDHSFVEVYHEDGSKQYFYTQDWDAITDYKRELLRSFWNHPSPQTFARMSMVDRLDRARAAVYDSFFYESKSVAGWTAQGVALQAFKLLPEETKNNLYRNLLTDALNSIEAGSPEDGMTDVQTQNAHMKLYDSFAKDDPLQQKLFFCDIMSGPSALLNRMAARHETEDSFALIHEARLRFIDQLLGDKKIFEPTKNTVCPADEKSGLAEFQLLEVYSQIAKLVAKLRSSKAVPVSQGLAGPQIELFKNSSCTEAQINKHLSSALGLMNEAQNKHVRRQYIAINEDQCKFEGMLERQANQSFLFTPHGVGMVAPKPIEISKVIEVLKSRQLVTPEIAAPLRKAEPVTRPSPARLASDEPSDGAIYIPFTSNKGLFKK
ncbi:MAG: hypothetical protein AB7N80_10140 [Bdellovibrionales bacterium]